MWARCLYLLSHLELISTQVVLMTPAPSSTFLATGPKYLTSRLPSSLQPILHKLSPNPETVMADSFLINSCTQLASKSWKFYLLDVPSLPFPWPGPWLKHLHFPQGAAPTGFADPAPSPVRPSVSPKNYLSNMHSGSCRASAAEPPQGLPLTSRGGSHSARHSTAHLVFPGTTSQVHVLLRPLGHRPFQPSTANDCRFLCSSTRSYSVAF